MPTPSAAWLSARNTVLAFSLLAASGCSQRPPTSACGPVAHQLSDPAEPANRAVFAFNRSVDDYLLAPLARGYVTGGIVDGRAQALPLTDKLRTEPDYYQALRDFTAQQRANRVTEGKFGAPGKRPEHCQGGPTGE